MMRQYPVEFRAKERRKFHTTRWLFERRVSGERRCGFDRRAVPVTEQQPAIAARTAWGEQ